ncbi:MAG: SDR family NAD(P)-dependent oxidoreductase [Woeseiaceae bacterium]|nr:SDR family NAD(P)-dependent oxidoreductase [Woeseiaceae bacterium]
MTRLIVIVVALCAIGVQPGVAADKEQRAVLITGASTGIGRVTAELLASEGFFVYAGARKQKDIDALNAIDNIMAVRLDVTKQDEIDAAVALVEAEGRGLYGLVNNAGVFVGGPQTALATEDFEWMMDINVIGVYRVTAAFAPMIIASKGNITNISSISGILSAPMAGQYAATKHAVEAMSDALAAEVAPFGVTVSVVEPGNYNSKIGDTAWERMKDKPFAKEGALYADQVRGIMEYIRESRDRFKEPDEVAEAILHAMSSDLPLRRYTVVPNEGEASWVMRKAATEFAEYNQWHPYRYSRDELVGFIDDALSTRSLETGVLEKLVNEFLANTNERETHAAFWANDLVYTSSNGTRFGKREILSGFDEEPGVAADWPTYSAEDMSVRIHGDTAVVTFKLVGTPAADSDEPTMYYFNTGTFLKRQGAWQAIAWQATKIPEQ